MNRSDLERCPRCGTMTGERYCGTCGFLVRADVQQGHGAPSTAAAGRKWRGALVAILVAASAFVVGGAIVASQPDGGTNGTQDPYCVLNSTYTEDTDTFYFLNFETVHDYYEVTWETSPLVTVRLLTFTQFNLWYSGHSYTVLRDVTASNNISLDFSDLPSGQTDPPDNAIVILFTSSTPRCVAITMLHHYYTGTGCEVPEGSQAASSPAATA